MNDIKAKKFLGQNFLHDEAVLDQILSVAGVAPTDWVFEIGPGTGVLTERLSPRVAKLSAIELDHELVVRLQKSFVDSRHVSILEGNILDIHLAELLIAQGFSEHPYKIIANIPYYITAPIIRTLLALPYQPESLTLMVQNEVADRLAAGPGKMSLLSLMAQYYATVEKKFFVSKEAFEPVPRVDSAVVFIVPKRPYDQEKDRALFRLARAGFAARRKTLANNLASTFALPKVLVEEKLLALGLAKNIRAQALSCADWEQLSLLEEFRV